MSPCNRPHRSKHEVPTRAASQVHRFHSEEPSRNLYREFPLSGALTSADSTRCRTEKGLSSAPMAAQVRTNIPTSPDEQHWIQVLRRRVGLAALAQASELDVIKLSYCYVFYHGVKNMSTIDSNANLVCYC